MPSIEWLRPWEPIVPDGTVEESPVAETIAKEAQRYLSAVTTFRECGIEITWNAESVVELADPHCEKCGAEVPWPQRYCEGCQA
jgi:hypothetical protein